MDRLGGSLFILGDKIAKRMVREGVPIHLAEPWLENWNKMLGEVLGGKETFTEGAERLIMGLEAAIDLVEAARLVDRGC